MNSNSASESCLDPPIGSDQIGVITKPLYELLEKDSNFFWDDRCQASFKGLKLHLTTVPIVRAPNWQLPFEVMCDASDFSIGAILGHREDGKPYVVYCASKTLNEA